MCHHPFTFFRSPKLTQFWYGCARQYASDHNCDVVQQELGMCLLVPFLKRYREEITQVLNPNESEPHHSEAYSSTILFLSWLLARQLDFWAWMLYHLSHFLQLYHLKSGFERASECCIWNMVFLERYTINSSNIAFWTLASKGLEREVPRVLY
jgi:hypothetical protein